MIVRRSERPAGGGDDPRRRGAALRRPPARAPADADTRRLRRRSPAAAACAERAAARAAATTSRDAASAGRRDHRRRHRRAWRRPRSWPPPVPRWRCSSGGDVAAAASGRNAGLILAPAGPGHGATSTAQSLEMYRAIEGTELPDGRTFVLPAAEIGMLGLSADVDLMRRLAASFGTELIDGAGPARARADGGRRTSSACAISRGFAVRPADATHAFATVARRLGAEIRSGAEARPWVEDGVARGVELAGGERVAAGAVLVAAGWWTSALVDPIGALAAGAGRCGACSSRWRSPSRRATCSRRSRPRTR